MRKVETKLNQFFGIELERHFDERGHFEECFRKDVYAQLGVDVDFVQQNHSRSQKHVLRGLHYQTNGQSQIVSVLSGELFYVGVDLREGSDTFGNWCSVFLSSQGLNQLFTGAHIASGFLVLSDIADVHYNVTEYYDPSAENGIFWDDPALSINWPCSNPSLSDRDQNFQYFEEFCQNLMR